MAEHSHVPAGPSGITWLKRKIPTDSIEAALESKGHSLASETCQLSSGANAAPVPLSRRTTAKQFVTDSNGDVTESGNENTYTEWELKDINGDGYPDFVYDGAHVVLDESSDGSGNTSHTPVFEGFGGTLLGAVDIDALFNVGGITMSVDGTQEMFSAAKSLLLQSQCALEQWEVQVYVGLTIPIQTCTIADITGDGIPERLDNGLAYIGVGGEFSLATIPMGVPAMPEVEFTGELSDCGTGLYSYGIVGGLRDVTGDGIPDMLVSNGTSQAVYIGTGVGFAPPIPVSGLPAGDFAIDGAGIHWTGLPLSEGPERCDGTESDTAMGIYDVDGDGKGDFVWNDGLGNEVYMVASETSGIGGIDAGQLIQIDNGHNASTVVTYTSAKSSVLAHQLPFPEVVVSQVSTMTTIEMGQVLEPTRYAYGDSFLRYDNVTQAFRFDGYQRQIALQLDERDGLLNGNATITDTYGLSLDASQDDAQRFNSLLLAGQTKDEITLTGAGTDPWALLQTTGIPSNTIKMFTTLDGSGTPQYASQFVTETPPTDEAPLDCLEYLNPYDFDAAEADAFFHFRACSTYGFIYNSMSQESRGSAAFSDTSVTTETDVLAVDDLGRPTSINYKNDLATPVDDLCVTFTYAEPSGSGGILTAPRTERIAACGDGQDEVMSLVTYDYDGASDGSIGSGFVSGESLERHNASDGTLIDVVRVFDATPDAVGNVQTKTRTRDTDRRVQTTAYSYDSFGLVRTGVTMTGTSVPTIQVSMAPEPLSLAPSMVTDANGTQHSMQYDGFDRPVQLSVHTSDGESGVLSTTSYVGFSTTDAPRTIITTTYCQATPGSSPVTTLKVVRPDVQVSRPRRPARFFAFSR